MTPGPKTQKLIDLLAGLANLLREHQEAHWADWLDRDAQLLRRCDLEGIRDFLSAFGGMGSLNDLILSRLNGHKISDSEAPNINKLLTAELEDAVRLAREIEKDAQQSE